MFLKFFLEEKWWGGIATVHYLKRQSTIHNGGVLARLGLFLADARRDEIKTPAIRRSIYFKLRSAFF